MNFNEIENKVANKYIKLLMDDSDDYSLKTIALKAKIKYEEALIVFPYDDKVNEIKYMKVFLTNLDNKVLKEFFSEVKEDEISFYEKLLEGIILRFDELLKYKKAIKKLSLTLNKKIVNFKVLFFDNHLFMFKLLKLSGDKDKFIKLNIKAFILNGFFTRFFLNFINNDDNDLDSLIRKIDSDLKILFENKILFKN